MEWGLAFIYFRAIGNILEGLGVAVDVKGDLINARIKKYEQEIIEEKLDMLGRLNLFTRQMDILTASFFCNTT